MFYIYELQIRPDGVVNVVDTVARSTEALARAYFYERVSKACASEQFTKVGVMMVKEDMTIMLHNIVTTAYTAPETEESANTLDGVALAQ